jgi:hypothetical protein
MKKTIILLGILFSHLMVSGQYKPMLEPGKVWTQHFDYSTLGGLSDSISMSGADSLINGIPYYKLDGVLQPGDFFGLPTIGNPILAREDTLTGKVWIYVDSVELLFYDFSVSQGDTVTVFVNNSISSGFCDSMQSFHVTNIDTFIDLEGMPRKEIHLQPLASTPYWCVNNFPVIWIEGIGSDRGFNLIANEGMLTYLLCTWKSGVQLFQGIAYGDTCWVGSTIGVKDYEKHTLHIYPNPATDKVVISDQHPIPCIVRSPGECIIAAGWWFGDFGGLRQSSGYPAGNVCVIHTAR